MPTIARERITSAAQQILDEGAWCVFEVCMDVLQQRWESRALIFKRRATDVADVVLCEIVCEPKRDARLTGCDRRTLVSRPDLGEFLCYVADTPALEAVAEPANEHTASARGRPPMMVRDGMNPIIVTAGPDHTLREAARRMTAHGVGAAVVVDESQPGPCIVTERDILHSKQEVAGSIPAGSTREVPGNGTFPISTPWARAEI